MPDVELDEDSRARHPGRDVVAPKWSAATALGCAAPGRRVLVATGGYHRVLVAASDRVATAFLTDVIDILSIRTALSDYFEMAGVDKSWMKVTDRLDPSNYGHGNEIYHVRHVPKRSLKDQVKVKRQGTCRQQARTCRQIQIVREQPVLLRHCLSTAGVTLSTDGTSPKIKSSGRPAPVDSNRAPVDRCTQSEPSAFWFLISCLRLSTADAIPVDRRTENILREVLQVAKLSVSMEYDSPHAKLCGNKAVDIADLQKNGMGNVIAAMERMKWSKLVTLSETEEDGSLTSSVKGTQIRITYELLESLFGVCTTGHSGAHTVDIQVKGLGIVGPEFRLKDGKLDINQMNPFNRLLHFIICQILVPRSATFSTCTKADSDMMLWAIQNQEINVAEVILERMKFAHAQVWDTKNKLNVSLPYAHLLTKIFQHFGINLFGAVVEKMG
ncbi:hypothetical protein Taro_012695 [Colocasia esculenta]|uniref:Uncharacterized protein n=1 Tax=Colocasia esculenta TaxID=4460 RepID=A0A843UGH0_COLES|nr:hypothetical protein [Colocasia esculenta]